MDKNYIRPANEGDLERLMQILYQLSPPKDGEEQVDLQPVLKRILADPSYFLNVYEAEGKIIGTSMLFVQHNLTHGGKSVAHLENVVVDEDFIIHHGVGTSLVMDSSKVAAQQGCYKSILNCTQKNIPFYKRCLFKETGEIEMRQNL